MKKLGIDLGTTNTVAAMEDRVLGLHENGSATLPSVVAFLPNGRVMLGETARRRRAIDGANTIFSSKRIIGCRWESEAVRRYRERYPVALAQDGRGGAAFDTRSGLKTPIEVATLLLSTIYDRVEQFADDLEVVITVPISFNEQQQDATLEAAESAGFDCVRLVTEPVATAWAYAIQPRLGKILAVYDLGGGTLDVSIIERTGTRLRLLSHSSDPFLGGDDIDHEIAAWVHRHVLKEANWDLHNNNEVAIRLLVEAERAKVRLARDAETSVDLSQVDPDCPLAGTGVTLHGDQLDRLAGDLVRRTFISCDQAVADAGLQPGAIDSVLLAGGGSHLRLVREGIEGYFGRAGLCDIEPTEVVARGASLVED